MTASLASALAVWRVIADIVRETRGSVVNLRPARIKRRAAVIGVRVDRHFTSAMRLILKYAFRGCGAACIRRNGRGGYKPICYVYSKQCVEEKLRAIGL